MSDTGRVPSWGVLAKAGQEQVDIAIWTLRSEFDFENMEYHISGEWMAIFYMTDSDPSNGEAAEALRRAGLVPVYRFDFNKYEYETWLWDGAEWSLLQSEPGDVLYSVGISIPGTETPPTHSPVVSRQALVMESFSVQEVAWVLADHPLGSQVHAEPGPLGAIVYDVDASREVFLWRNASERTFAVLCYPKLGIFRFSIMHGDSCVGTFMPGVARSWDGTPFLDGFEGACTAGEILGKLGIPQSFLDPLPVTGGHGS